MDAKVYLLIVMAVWAGSTVWACLVQRRYERETEDRRDRDMRADPDPSTCWWKDAAAKRRRDELLKETVE